MKLLSIGTWAGILLILAIYVYRNLLFDLSGIEDEVIFLDQKVIWSLILGSATLIGILMMQNSYKTDKSFIKLLFAFCPFLYVSSILIYIISKTFFQFEELKIFILISTLLNLCFFAYLSFSRRVRKS